MKFLGEEDEINPSLIKEFERFGNNLGMFNNEQPGVLDNKGFYTSVQKKYIFENFINNDSNLDNTSFNFSNLNKSHLNNKEDENQQDSYSKEEGSL